jgi:hypothetical protein
MKLCAILASLFAFLTGCCTTTFLCSLGSKNPTNPLSPHQEEQSAYEQTEAKERQSEHRSKIAVLERR